MKQVLTPVGLYTTEENDVKRMNVSDVVEYVRVSNPVSMRLSVRLSVRDSDYELNYKYPQQLKAQ